MVYVLAVLEFSMEILETVHVWNAPGKGFFLQGMCCHSILGILTLDFKRLSAFLSLITSNKSGGRNISVDKAVSPSPESVLMDKRDIVALWSRRQAETQAGRR